MASSKEYLEFILGQLSELEEITYRAMMGEFIIYYRGKIAGGIYDDRLLVKPVKSAISYMPTVATVYKGNIIKNLIMDCQSYTKYRPNETTGGIFVSWRRKEELPTGA